MAFLTRRRPRERGVAALEFAIVAPMMVGLFGVLISFALVLWTQFCLGSLAQTTVRYCVARQASTGSVADMTGCATSTPMQQYLSQNQHYCDTPLTVTVLPAVAPLSAGMVRPVNLLTIKLSCHRNFFGWIRIVNNSLVRQSVSAQASMPFTP